MSDHNYCFTCGQYDDQELSDWTIGKMFFGAEIPTRSELKKGRELFNKAKMEVEAIKKNPISLSICKEIEHFIKIYEDYEEESPVPYAGFLRYIQGMLDGSKFPTWWPVITREDIKKSLIEDDEQRINKKILGNRIINALRWNKESEASSSHQVTQKMSDKSMAVDETLDNFIGDILGICIKPKYSGDIIIEGLEFCLSYRRKLLFDSVDKARESLKESNG